MHGLPIRCSLQVVSSAEEDVRCVQLLLLLATIKRPLVLTIGGLLCDRIRAEDLSALQDHRRRIGLPPVEVTRCR